MKDLEEKVRRDKEMMKKGQELDMEKQKVLEEQETVWEQELELVQVEEAIHGEQDV